MKPTTPPTKQGVRRYWTTAQQWIGDTDGTFKLWPKKPWSDSVSIKPIPIAVLDLRAEAVEGYVERAAKACFEVGFGSGEIWEDAPPIMRMAARIEAEAALEVILGPLPKRGKAKGDQ